MTTTWLLITLFVLFSFGTLALQTYALKWGLRWTKIAEISAVKALLLIVAFFLGNLIVGIGLGIALLPFSAHLNDPLLNILSIPFAFVAPTIIIAKAYRAKPLRALQSLVPPTVATLVLTMAAVFVVRPYVYETFVIPTNAMAPTILGVHSQSVCPKCGKPSYGSVPESEFEVPPEGLPMICTNCHTFYVPGQRKKADGGDRIFVNKLLKPRRWDIVAFRFPAEPSINYIKRLVGLPSERLFIRDGAVWINDERLEPPDELKGIEYLMTLGPPDRPLPSSADPAHPAVLGPDEYFVLGDFSANSSDSRLWERGAPGHPRYAVPEGNIIGVVTHIYWPISRWRTFR